MEVSADGKQVTMRFEGGETFVMKTDGQDTISVYSTLQEAIQRTFPTLVRLSQLTEPNRVYGRDHQEKGRKQIGWAQAPFGLGCRNLKMRTPTPAERKNTPEDKLTDLRNGEQAIMAIRPKLIGAGYRTLDSILRIQKASGVRFYRPPLKGVDKRTQEIVKNWIQKLRKFPAHLHALNMKEAQAQKYPEVEQPRGMKTTQLADKYIVKHNTIQN